MQNTENWMLHCHGMDWPVEAKARMVRVLL
jgi:hypothetical protein